MGNGYKYNQCTNQCMLNQDSCDRKKGHESYRLCTCTPTATNKLKFSCGCMPGYKLAGVSLPGWTVTNNFGFNYNDCLNPCQLPTNGCDKVNGICTAGKRTFNSNFGYKCSCKAGYKARAGTYGGKCDKIDPCGDSNNQCAVSNQYNLNPTGQTNSANTAIVSSKQYRYYGPALKTSPNIYTCTPAGSSYTCGCKPG